jgi:aminoglycoside phosphotransferase (APT) family kinase protein
MTGPAPGAGEPPADTGEVGERHRFDVAALEGYLGRHLPGFQGPLRVRQFQGGQSNPTYYLVTPGGQDYVLRRKPPGQLLPSAHAVDREYRVIAALAGSGIPVPRAYLLCEDPAVIGTAFYVMSHVPGRIFRHPSLPGLPERERRPLYQDAVEVLARLHLVDWRAVGLAEFGRPGSYYGRQIHRWTQQYRASETETIPAMERLIEWLPAHQPADDATTLVHGDYRIGNLVVDAAAPRVAAVLDWELSTLGHPLADLAYFCLPFRLTPDTFEGLAGLDLAPQGLPTEAEVVAAYCARTGRPGIPAWDFYVAFALFRLAAILQGIMGRVLAGTANDPRARDRGLRARPLAEAAWRVASRGHAESL